jgi:hypothetical protein
MIRRLFSYPFFLHYPASNQQDHRFVSCDQSDNDLHITDDPRRLAYAFQSRTDAVFAKQTGFVIKHRRFKTGT